MLIALGVLNLTGVLRYCSRGSRPARSRRLLAFAGELAVAAPWRNWLDRNLKELGLYNALRPLAFNYVLPAGSGG